MRCDCCKRQLKDQSRLLRHIGHKTECKDHYGDDFSRMKRDARLQSKRKWNDKETTKELQFQRAQSDRPKRNQARRERHHAHKAKLKSEKGQAFSQFFNLIFREYERDQVDDYVFDKAYSIIYDKAHDHSLNYTMGTDFWQSCDVPTGSLHFWDPKYESEIYNRISDALEISFNKRFKENLEEYTDDLVKKIRDKVWSSCYIKMERWAFNQFFDEFCTTVYSDAIDEAMDFAFDELEELTAASFYITHSKLGFAFDDKYKQILNEAAKSSDMSKRILVKVKTAIDDNARAQVAKLEESKPECT